MPYWELGRHINMKRRLLFGLILITIGVIFLLRATGLLWFDWGDFWSLAIPFSLIGLGGWLLVRHRRTESRAQMEADFGLGSGGFAEQTDGTRTYSFTSTSETRETNAEAMAGQPGNKLRYSKMFGDLNINCKGLEIEDVEISMFLGDIRLVLSDCKLANGLNRVIISGFIGDILVIVPPDLPVQATGSVFLGEVEILGQTSSTLGASIETKTPNYTPSGPRVYIAANHFIGDLKIITA